MEPTGFIAEWGLTATIFLPLLGALVMVLVPREEEQIHKLIALVSSLAVLGIGIGVVAKFLSADVDMAFIRVEEWIPALDIRYAIGMDGISVAMFALTISVVPLCIIYSWNHIPDPGNPKMFLMLMLILETGMIGTFAAQDLILFFVFFEIVLLPMYFMIGVWGGPERKYASIKFFLYTLFGSALMLVSFVALYWLTTPAGGEGTWLLNDLIYEGQSFAGLAGLASALTHTEAIVIFGGMFIGFGVKVPMWPFHTWLPDAHTQAPTVGSVILAAVLLKLGTYGYIRIAIPILPEAAATWAPVIGVLAVIGIIYGALGCLAQTDMKRLIAFSSVAHMGFVMLAIATLTDVGMQAAVFGMIAHGLITGMLFFIAGSVKERYHTLEISRLGGLLVSAPRMGWLLGICSMASLGLPGLAGFWGEFPAILAAYEPLAVIVTPFGLSLHTVYWTFMFIAALGTVLAAGYLLWLYQRTAFGTPNDEWADTEIHDVLPTEWLAWIPLMIGIVLFGLYPRPIFDLLDEPSQNIENCVLAGNAGSGLSEEDAALAAQCVTEFSSVESDLVVPADTTGSSDMLPGDDESLTGTEASSVDEFGELDDVGVED